MFRKGFILSVIMLFACTVFAQNRSTINGQVVDTLDQALAGSTVLLNAVKDSVLVSYAITDADGQFEILKIPEGEYYIQVNSIGFDVYQQDVEITEAGSSITLDKIKLAVDPSTNIDAVIVEQAVPMALNGDTIEYNSAAFKVDRNDAVEDLIKQLPGMEVEADGSIKAMGKDVEKVYVDGKEFFGDDPTIATKNLPADAVKKIQVYDKKSDRSEFTGVDDGRRTTSINLKLKPGRKSGYFGKVDAGGGSDSRYNGKANVNRFTKDSQVSGLASLNNVNQRSFSWRDYVNMNGGIGGFSGGGGRSIQFQGGGQGQDSGVNNSGTVGANLNYFPNKKIDLHGDYFYNTNENNYSRALDRQNIIPAGFYDYLENSNGLSESNNHRANLNMEWKVNDMTEIEIKNNLNFADSFQDSATQSETFNTSSTLENTLDNLINGNGDNVGYGSLLMLKQRFNKKGRSLFIEGGYDKDNKDYIANNLSTTSFLGAGTTDVLDQNLISDEFTDGFDANLSYTEPLGKKQYLEARYEFNQSNEDSEKNYFDQVGGVYVPNTTLSNNTLTDRTRHNAGLYYRVVKGKHNVSVGGAMRYDNIEGITNVASSNIAQDYTRFMPSLSWRYEMTDSRNLSLNYSTSLNLPSIGQLQPNTDNSNPLNLYVGNPNLRAAYSHRARLNFFSFDQFTFTNVFAFINTTFTNDKITNAQFVDANLAQTTMPVNVENDFTTNANVSFSRPIRAIKTRVRINPNLTYNKGSVFINGVENDLTRFNPSIRLGLSNTKTEKMSVRVNSRWRFNTSKYSENENFDQSYLDQSHSLDYDWNLPKEWQFSSDMAYRIFSKETYGDENTFAIWNASIGKSFLENNRAEMRLSFNDILNQNTGISRQSDVNYTQEELSNTIGQYGMLSFSYNLSRVGNKSSEATRLGN